MYTDPISDYLTRIRNANSAGHRVVDIPASKIKKEITKILFDQGFILSYKFEETQNNQGNIKIALKKLGLKNQKLKLINQIHSNKIIHINKREFYVSKNFSTMTQ